MAIQIRIRRDTTANWTAADPVLALGELAYDTTAKSIKVGDGVLVWSGLTEITGGLDEDVLDDYVLATDLTTTLGGYATDTELSTAIDALTLEGGASAYAIAVANGFVGNEAAWLLSLKGANGAAGANGATGAAGAAGAAGATGASAYATAVANGFVGTSTEWLLTLQGAQGDDGAAGNVPTIENFPAGSTFNVYYNTGTSTWPARPTARTDITIQWIGGTAGTPPTAGVKDIDLWLKESA